MKSRIPQPNAVARTIHGVSKRAVKNHVPCNAHAACQGPCNAHAACQAHTFPVQHVRPMQHAINLCDTGQACKHERHRSFTHTNSPCLHVLPPACVYELLMASGQRAYQVSHELHVLPPCNHQVGMGLHGLYCMQLPLYTSVQVRP